MLTSILRVIRISFATVVLVGLIGGVSADIPGAKEDPLGGWITDFTTNAFLYALYIVRTYPIGIFLTLILVAFLDYLFTYRGDTRLKNEYRERRNTHSQTRAQPSSVQRRKANQKRVKRRSRT